MDRYEETTSQSSHAESRLPQLMLNYEQKSMQNDNFLKVNGDHKVPQHIFPSDDESSGASSHSSSSSPRNLVIDHPDETSKDGIEDKGQKEDEPQVSQPGILLPHSSSAPPSNLNEKKRTIKRKLSLRDTTNPSLPKKRRHSAKPMDMISTERAGSISVSGNGLPKEEHFNRNVESISKPIKKRTGPFREYASYLGLKPTTIPIKCFKCSNANFENLSQLRDHQKICLFKDKQRNSLNTLDTKNNANITKHLENLNDGLQNSNSVEMLNSSLGPKQKPTAGLPLNNTTARAKKRVFLCSACGTYYENWNLFLHMREVHKRHICLYCIGMFPSAERLTFHLEMKHDLEQNHFDSQEKLLRSSRDSCYLMCCVCEHLFTEHEDFSDHKCADHQQPCALCGQKGRHLANCKAGSQSNKSKHKDHYAKRKSKASDKNSSLPHPPADFTLDKASNAFVNGGDNHAPETSILRKIITDRDRVAKRSEDILPAVKTNGCAEIPVFRNVENGGPSYELPMHPAAHGIHNEQQSFENLQFKNVVPMENVQPAQPIENIEPPPPPPDENSTRREEQSKTQESFESSLSQSNTTSELTPHSNSSPEKEANESLNKSDISQTQQEGSVEPKPLFVPKFKIKIPKEFQTPMESEQSSTESDDNDVDRSDNGDEEQSEASDMDIEEDNAEVSTENAKSDAKAEQEETGGQVEKANDEITSLDDKKILKPDDTLPDQVFSPEKSPLKAEENESKEELSMEEPMQTSDLKNESDPVEGESPSNKITEADEDIPLQDLLLQQPLDKIDMIEFMRICLKITFRICLYCNHARRIAVNGQSLALHLISNHRFSATVDSITAEELKPTTIVQKLKSYLPDLENVFFNLETFGGNDKENLKPYEKLFECFQCRFETKIHKELYLHNRKMHLKPAILCFMCRSNFFSYSEILCHMCPGVPNKCVIFDIKFRCCLCDLDSIPSAFRLMVHLRKKHFACDVCLEDCYDQSRLSSHVWKHKLHHLCYRCGIAYRNKPDITKHLFWKHGTESVLCKRCLQKRWPHVYHFCIPPASFVCEVCNISFSRAMALKVHKRLHTGDAPYPCPEDGCDQKFISRKLLLKHTARHNEPIPVLVEAKKEEIKEEETEKAPEVTPIEELKVEQDEGVEKEEKAPEAEIKVEEQDQLKKKKKRSKKNKENLDDLMDLPAPNLSESDSSEESDSEKSKLEKVVTPVPQVMLSPPSDAEEKEETTTVAGTQIMDIWENFKSFQASQQAQVTQEDSDDNDDAPPPPILHVTQSDHDYCMMFKPISKLTKSISAEDLKEIKPEKTEGKPEHSSPKKKQKSPRKGQRSGSESSSSGSSSSSDSSCSCGPNCSCASSSGSSSDSSSSSDSESSSSEGRRRAAAKRAAKLESKNKSKEDEKKPEEKKVQSPKLDTSDYVDVVSTDTKSQEIVDPDSIILESDLETEESDTDEDFYDEHPQKMANQLLTEKRKQLLMQTSLSPSHNFDIVENSRPSTPSIPEEMVKEKKVKLKKRKRDKKVSKTENNEPTFKHDIPSPSHSSVPMEQVTALDDSTSMHMPPVNTSSSPIPLEHDKSFDEESLSQPLPSGSVNMMMPAPITPRDRLSTGSSSDPDGNLKRSKRRRRPNKFYGYSSDDDGLPPGMIMSGPAAFKPTPPPNLTWRKEDLPAPSTKSSHHRSHKSSATSSKKTNSVQPIAPSLPPIPPIIIRPSALLSKKPLSVENAAYKPPIVQPIRVPPVPVHHIRPPQYVSPTRSFDDSDSSSDDDHRLTIMTPVARKTTKTPRARQQKSKNQQQQQEKQQSQSSQKHSQAYPMQQLSQQQSQIEAATPVKQPKPIPPALLPNPDAARIEYFKRNNIRWPIQPPAGARPPREGESVYCYCRCPYDEVSEMIACDGDDCMIEWFHFECVGILVPPQGKWFCPECRPLYPNEAGSSMEVT